MRYQSKDKILFYAVVQFLLFLHMPGEDNQMREFEQNGYRVRIDLSQQVLGLEILPDREVSEFIHGQSINPENRTRDSAEMIHESDLFAKPSDIYGEKIEFISAALFMAKAKQFDDGLYAAVEYLCQNGTDEFMGKKQILQRTLLALKEMNEKFESHQLDFCRGLIGAALKLGGTEVDMSGRTGVAIKTIKENFLASPLRSKPISFYTWNDELRRIFQQDRLLQHELETPYILPLSGSLTKNPKALKFYSDYLKFIQKLTNPFPPEYRGIAGLSAIEPNLKYCFFPPSMSTETELIKKLYANRPVPEGFKLIDALIEHIRKNKINLIPGEQSSWYDHQLFALEPLVVPEKTPEAEKLFYHETYKQELLNLFKSAIALTRETHIKQLEIPVVGAAIRPPSVDIHPGLTMEPLFTYYQRRAESYAYIRQLIEDTFGRKALKQIFRLTPDGHATIPLYEELRWIESLFYGACRCTATEIGMALTREIPNRNQRQTTGDVRTMREWKSSLKKDPDLDRDLRMMVPLYYDLQRKKTKVWVMLGFTRKPLSITFKNNPTVTVTDRQGKPVKTRIKYKSELKKLIYPVSAEIYVGKILNRREFRELCDKYRTGTKILDRLRNL